LPKRDGRIGLQHDARGLRVELSDAHRFHARMLAFWHRRIIRNATADEVNHHARRVVQGEAFPQHRQAGLDNNAVGFWAELHRLQVCQHNERATGIVPAGVAANCSHQGAQGHTGQRNGVVVRRFGRFQLDEYRIGHVGQVRHVSLWRQLNPHRFEVHQGQPQLLPIPHRGRIKREHLAAHAQVRWLKLCAPARHRHQP